MLTNVVYIYICVYVCVDRQEHDLVETRKKESFGENTEAISLQNRGDFIVKTFMEIVIGL